MDSGLVGLHVKGMLEASPLPSPGIGLPWDRQSHQGLARLQDVRASNTETREFLVKMAE